MGVTPTTVHRYCIAGTIPCTKINRKIFIRRKDVEHLFDAAAPYVFTPIEKEPITEFYSLQEIVKKYNCSPSLVYTTVKDEKIPYTEFRGKNIYSKKHIDKHMAHRIPEPTIFTQLMSPFDIPRNFLSTNPARKSGGDIF